MEGIIYFLEIEEVLAIHQDCIEREGGNPSILDIRLLESALAQPQATFGGEYLYKHLRNGGRIPFPHYRESQFSGWEQENRPRIHALVLCAQ